MIREDGRKDRIPTLWYSVWFALAMSLTSILTSTKRVYFAQDEAKIVPEILIHGLTVKATKQMARKDEEVRLSTDSELSINQTSISRNGVADGLTSTLNTKQTSPANAIKSPLMLSRNITLHEKSRLIAFIHIGKTGGTTISERALPHLRCKLLRRQITRQKQCHKRASLQSSPLREASTLEFHVRYIQGRTKQNVQRKVTSFLFSTRNPIDRALSAYHFLHYNNREQSQVAKTQNPTKDDFYIKCFPTINNLLEAVNGTFEIAANESLVINQLTPCQKLAIEVLHGKEEYTKHANFHLYWNYKRYFDTSVVQFPSKEVFVVRLAHLWDDLISLDRATGGSGVFKHAGVASRQTVAVPNNQTKETASPEQYKQLCCVLIEEIGVYQKLILRADNLNGIEKLEDLQQVSLMCGADLGEEGLVDWDDWHSRNCPDLNPYLVNP